MRYLLLWTFRRRARGADRRSGRTRNGCGDRSRARGHALRWHSARWPVSCGGGFDMCRILSIGAPPLVIFEAYRIAHDDIGAAVHSRGAWHILPHLSLADALSLSSHGARGILHFRRAGSKSRFPSWVQPVRTRTGAVLAVVGSRKLLRDALAGAGFPVPDGTSPVHHAAAVWCPAVESVVRAVATELAVLPP